MVNYTKKKYLNLFLKLSFVFLCMFCFTKNVNAQVRYEEFVPDAVTVVRSDNTYATQSPTSFNFLGTNYYGFNFGTAGNRKGLIFNYAEKSTINDKFIESVHFTIYSVQNTYYERPISVYLTDSYNNIISCQSTDESAGGEWFTNGEFQAEQSISKNLSSFKCEKGHLAGWFKLVVGDTILNGIGNYGVSELSFHYNDGSSQDSSTLNDIKGNTKETNDLLKDSNVEDSGIGNIQNNENLPTTGGIQDLLTMPIRFLTSLSTSINGTCSPISLPYINETTIVLPCYDLGSKLGILWTLIDLFGVFIIIKTFGKTLKRIFVDFTSLNLNKGDLIE